MVARFRDREGRSLFQIPVKFYLKNFSVLDNYLEPKVTLLLILHVFTLYQSTK